jgi:uncharacterized delta-60 repeat protein
VKDRRRPDVDGREMITTSRLVVVRLALAAVLSAAAGCGSGRSSGTTPEPSPGPTPAPATPPIQTPLAAGTLDPSFGDGGIARDALAGLESADQLLLLPDGRILVAAVADGGLVLARFLADGRADPSFGGDGRTRVYDATGSTLRMSWLEPSSDGGLVFATSVDGQPALIRATGDGVLDDRFGDGGVAIDARRDAPVPLGLDEDASGRLLTVGARADVATLARYLPDGTPDTSFGQDGLLQIAPYVEDARCSLSTVVVQPDEHVVAGGVCYGFGPPSLPLLVRVAADGDGEAEHLLPRDTLPAIRGVKQLVALDDGRFFLSMFDQPAIASFTLEGAGRTDFGTQGLSPFLPGASLSPLAVDAAERPVAAGYFVADPSDVHLDLAVGRFTADGLPDASLGHEGLVVTPLGDESTALDVAVQDDGRIVVLAAVDGKAILLRYAGGALPE